MNRSSPPPQADLSYYPDLVRKRMAVQSALARAGTPSFLCDPDILLARYHALRDALAAGWQRHIIGYSFKTNYQVARARILQDAGAWAEVVSGWEYRRARELGYAGSAIIFNGPYKSDADLRAAVDEGAILNLNDHDELDRLIALTASAGTPFGVGIRLSSTLPRLGHSRFGFSLENEEALAALEKIERSPGLTLVGLHMHLHGDTDDTAVYRSAVERLGNFAGRHATRALQGLKYVDVGGGFPAHTPKPKSRDRWTPQEIGVYIHAITETLERFFPDNQAQPTLIVEPGRYLACDGIILVTRVIHVKIRDGRQVINCDGSMSMVPLTHYSPQILRVYTPELQLRMQQEKQTIIYGCTCRENDILYEGSFAETMPGDYLVHYAAGAYNSNLSPNFIFESPGMELI